MPRESGAGAGILGAFHAIRVDNGLGSIQSTGLFFQRDSGDSEGLGWEAILDLCGFGAGCIGFRCFR